MNMRRLAGTSFVAFVTLVWVAGLATTASAQTTFVQDTFTGTNGTLLSAHNPDTGNAGSWVKISGTGDLDIQNNQLQNTVAKNLVFYKNTTPPTGGSAEYVVGLTATWNTSKATDIVTLVARINGASNDRYEATLDTGSSTNNVVIQKVVGGTTTVLATGSLSITLATAHTIYFSVKDASKSLDVDGTTIVSTTDNSITAAGVAGLEQEGNAAGDTVIDDFFASTFTVTAVTLTSFSAIRQGGHTLLQWRTGYEVDNVGFRLYREQNGQRVRITSSLVPGTALLRAGQRISATAQPYEWWDLSAPNDGRLVQYWLEDVDLHGKSTWHGPIVPAGTTPRVPPR